MSFPQVSIILRTKNRNRFLRRALESIDSQVFTNYELLIINDGGAEEPVAQLLAEKSVLSQKTRLITNPISRGRDGAWRQGVHEASGTFYAVHDDDDTWDPEFLQKTTDFLHAHPTHSAVAVRLEVIAEEQNGDDFTELFRWIYQPHDNYLSLGNFLRANKTVPIATLYRTEAAREAMPEGNFPVVEDWLLNLSLALKGPFGFIEGKPLAFWHQRPNDFSVDTGNSITSLSQLHQQLDSQIRDTYLREYVSEYGLGLVLHLSGLHERLSCKLDRQEREIADLHRQMQSLSEEIRTLNEYRHTITNLSQQMQTLIEDLRTIPRPVHTVVRLSSAVIRKVRRWRHRN
ncbi:glycosyltransferase family 2 protein [Schaalia sp. lx-260]|uniref:glycosyltransferase family 2 protein n=1 Tax=Schaalia sp. lx-260 TaxID=2899082 RepID=UPI001E4A1BA1|nr:glycosyltransferase family 2 protein [Schaalia sp. lx-260]MCD4548948.1 glycosyltransferase family 2 protein [Schaalia sp. lx-260]